MAGFFDDLENTTSPVGNSFFDGLEETELDKERTVGSTLKDGGISLARGVVGAGQGLVGLADIPTGGRVGKGLESVGVKPDEWQQDLSGYYSPAQQAANQQVDNATGFVDTAKAMIQNPSTIAHGIVETLPSVAAGGVIGRGALALGSRLAPKAVTALGKTGSAIATGAVGEGTIGAGQTAEQIRAQTADDLLTGKQAGLAATAGLGTAVFGAAGGALANRIGKKLGIEILDIDTLATGLSQGKKKSFSELSKSMLAGGITEGVFEELPQTVQETIFTNAALDKPLLEGVPESSAQAIILGGAMGSGANLLPGAQQGPVKTETELELDRRAGNILAQKDDQIAQSITKLNEDLKAGQELLTDLDKLDQKARELNVSPAELTRKTVYDTKNTQDLLDRIKSEMTKKEELVKKEYEALSPEEKQVKDIENKLIAQRQAEAQKINDALEAIKKREEIARKQYKDEKDPEKKAAIAERAISLRKEKDALLDRQKELVENKSFAPYTTREDRQKYLEGLFGTVNVGEKVGTEKSAAESANVFQSNTTKLDEIQARIEQEKDVNKKSELQNLYNGLFQTFEKDAKESADIYVKELGNVDLVKQTMDQMLQESDPTVRQKLYNQMFVLPGVKNAQESAEVFTSTDVKTKTGRPYKSREYLEGIISELPNPESYEIIESPEGFIAVKKVLGSVDNSAFKNEQPVGEAAQFQVGETQFKPVDVKSANFRRWFAGSKVVDADGNPMVVYHGTMVPITEFRGNYRKGEQFGFGIHLTEDSEFASRYADKDLQGRKKGAGNVVPAYVVAKNILNADEIVVEGSPEYTLAYKLAYKLRPQLFANQYTENGSEKTGKKEVYLQHAIDAAQGKTAEKAIREAGYDGIWYESRVVGQPFAGRQTLSAKARSLIVFEPTQIKSAISNTGEFSPANPNINFDTVEKQNYIKQVTLSDIQKAFPGQTITQSEDGTISVQFKNGKGLTINSIQSAGQGYISLAIETGQMSKNGKILGITVGNKILLDDNFADNKTLWHENKHVLDNLGLITEADDSALNKEFNKLRKAGKLKFALSTHKDPKQAMVENRANMFAQIMTSRDAYRNTSFGKVIQRVMDFFQQLLAMGKQTVSGLAREVESGKIYERQVAGQSIKTTVPQYEEAASQWHSALENAINGFQQKIGTPDQWKGMIKGYPGIKQEELDWIGLDEWLDSKDGKVSKNALVNFIKDNNVQLEEVVKGYTPSTVVYEAFDKIDAALEPYEYTSKIYAGKLTFTSPEGFDVNEDNIDMSNISQEVKDIFQYAKSILPEALDDPKYEKYQLPGGENYKEILITVPIVKDGHFIDTYASAHWDEPNILTHIRFNERIDVDGNRVLFLEEVQSDWHQAGRKEGYNEELTITQRKEISNKLTELYEKAANLSDGEEYNNNYNEIEKLLRLLEGKNDGVPDAPFKKSWPLLAMKRMVRYAAENGFDKIAWTTGEQQADRYDLSKQIDNIYYENLYNNDVGWYYNIVANKNDSVVFEKSRMKEKDLEETFGQEIAKKIINGGDQGSLEGLDLQVGGEGMKGFYDQMLPSMLNKEFNRGKWGNAKVEPTDIGLQKDGKVAIKDAIKAFEEGKQVFVGDHLAQSRNEIETYPYDDLTMPMPEHVLSLPITNRMKSKALREGMPMFEVRETPEQKISDETLNQMYTERNSLVRTIGQTLRMRGGEIKKLLDKGLGSISTRLKNVDPMLRSEIRNLDFRTAQKIVTALRIAHPLLEKTKQMDPKDKFIWDVVRRNADDVRVKQMAEKYGMVQDIENLRTVLNQIRQDALDVGYDVGFIEEYWPRIIKDQEGFLQATKGISQRPVITDAIKKYADKLGMSVEKFEATYPEQAADIASNTILGRNLGIGGPGNIQARVYDVVPPELNKYYMDSDAALMQYIYSMTKKIEARRFFGKIPERIANLKTEKKRKTALLAEYELTNNTARIDDVASDLLRIEQELDKYKLQRDYTENIGTYINDLRMSGRIQAEDEKTVRDILDARFHEHGTTGPINAYKNMAYIDVMGSPLSALTQIGDLAWAMYVGKVWTPRGLSNTVKNLGKAITKKSEITKEDLGIERIAQEFADGTTLGNAVSWVFKKVGLERIDSIGKETLINNAFNNYKVMASTETGRTELLKQIKPIFGTQSESVINDLLAGNPTDNVKMLLYHRLLDFQPVALSEMPEQYLKSGNGRVFYMLKTYTIKQFDVFRNEAWHKIKSGEKDQVVEGIGNMIKLVSLLTLANAGADELKDLLLGKDIKFEDHVIENFLTMGGASKYVRMQTTREGLGSGLAGQILPPFRFVNSISKDLGQAYGDYVAGDTMNFDHARIVESIPIGGKLYYWNYGRGEDYKKSSNEQEFTNVGKEVKLFKRQLENVEDKRTFLNSNLDKFKQMKLHENFQASLNRNQAVINKLKDLEQTTNVRERLGQLQQQREMLLSKYFEVANGMQ